MTPVISFLPVPTMHALAWTLLHFLWQGAVLAFAAAIVMRCVTTTARARYGAGVVTLALMLAAPILTFVALQATAPVAAAADAARRATVAELVMAPPSDVTADVAGASAGIAVASNRLLPAVVLLWLAGVLLLSARLLGGWAVARRLAATSWQPVSAEVEHLATRVADRLGLQQVVRIAESSAVVVPIVIGWLKPVVLVPTAAVAGLSPAHLEALLAHELAHVRRNDYFVNLLQSMIETLLFYHPAVWWVSGRIRQEREHCCDDEVVMVCDRFVYVNALSDLAAMTLHTRLALAATDGSLLRRVRRLLTNNAEERPAAGWVSIGIIVVLLAVLTPVVIAVGAGDQQATAVPPPAAAAAVPASHAQGLSVGVPASETSIVLPEPSAIAAVPGSLVPVGQRSDATAQERDLARAAQTLRQLLAEREAELSLLARQEQQIENERVRADLRLRREAATQRLEALEQELRRTMRRHEIGIAPADVVNQARAQVAAADRDLRKIDVEAMFAELRQQVDAQQAAAELARVRLQQEYAAAAAHAEASTTPAAQTTAPEQRRVYTIGGDIREPRLLTRVEPSYPPVAKSAKMQGPVYVEAIIGQDGRVREAKAISGAPFPLLREAAVAAVQQWVYTPTLLNGQPIDVQLSVQVIFKLDTGESSELIAARRQLAEAKAVYTDNHPNVVRLTQQVRDLEETAAGLARLAEAARAMRAQAAAQQPPAFPLTDPTMLVRAGDLLVIDIAGEDQLPRWYVVEAAGTVRLPLIGRLAVVDRTAAQVRDAVARALAERKLAEGRAVTVVIHRQR